VSHSNSTQSPGIWHLASSPIIYAPSKDLDAVEAHGRNGSLKVAISDPRAFCDYVRRLSRRLFPKVRYVASPYSIRHGFAADQKAQKVSAEALAQMMGHVSDRSQRSYGVAQQGRQPLSHVGATSATRPVHHIGELRAQHTPTWMPGM
jgi:hypothetical protein